MIRAPICGTRTASKGLDVCRPEPQNLAVKVGLKLSTEPHGGETRTVIRKKRSRRHRQNRHLRRALLVVVCATLTIVFAAVSLRSLSPSLFDSSRRAEPGRQSAEASRNLVLAAQQEVLADMENRPVYPYSLVPGGVRNVEELKRAAQRDPVVAAHYAGFDYDHARMVRLVLARTAYVSYRIGNRVYWTRHRVTLKKGETLITDGNITARTRCANRVEEMPQQAASESEPPATKFDEPMQPALVPALKSPPVPFESSLLNRNPVAGLPGAPLSSFDPIANNGWAPMSAAPPPGLCGIGVKKKKPAEDTVTSTGGKKKKRGNPCGDGGGGPGGEVPEPGTWLLMASGAIGIYWKARHRFARSRTA